MDITASSDNPGSDWISKAESSRTLECSIAGVQRLIREGYLGTRRLPGLPVKVRRSDVEVLAEAAAKTATVAKAGPARVAPAEFNARKIVEGAIANARDLSPEESAQYDALMAKVEGARVA
jgi:hypothetical protein